MIPRRSLVSCLLAFPLIGCGDVGRLVADIDPASDHTRHFWAALQGIHFRTREDRDRLFQRVAVVGQDPDLDALAAAMDALAGGLGAIADQYGQLDASGVDRQAIDHRDRSVAGFREVARLASGVAEAARKRDLGGVKALNAGLQGMSARLESLRDERASLAETLSKRYGKDFNAVDR